MRVGEAGAGEGAGEGLAEGLAEGLWTDTAGAGTVSADGDTTVTIGDSDTLLADDLDDEDRRLMRENLLPCRPSILFMLRATTQVQAEDIRVGRRRARENLPPCLSYKNRVFHSKVSRGRRN